MKKILLLIPLLFLLQACEPAGHPVPADAFQACLDKNWRVYYFSNSGKTEFECKPYIIKD